MKLTFLLVCLSAYISKNNMNTKRKLDMCGGYFMWMCIYVQCAMHKCAMKKNDSNKTSNESQCKQIGKNMAKSLHEREDSVVFFSALQTVDWYTQQQNKWNMQIDRPSYIFIIDDDWWSTWRSLQIMNHDRTQWNVLVEMQEIEKETKWNEKKSLQLTRMVEYKFNVSFRLQEPIPSWIVIYVMFLFRVCARFLLLFVFFFSVLICDRNVFVFAMSQHSISFPILYGQQCFKCHKE